MKSHYFTLLIVYGIEACTIYFEKLGLEGSLIHTPGLLPLAYYRHAMEPPANYTMHTTLSICECKQICFTLSCMTFSVAIGNGPLSCNVSSEPVYTMALKKEDNVVTFAFDNSKYHLGDDGIFYDNVIMMSDYQNAKLACRRDYPNGQLHMLKTRCRFLSVLEYRKKNKLAENDYFFLMDLVYNRTAKQAKWGDGDLYYNTEISQSVNIVTTGAEILYYQAYTTGGVQTFKEKPATKETGSYICEMNPIPDV